MTDWKAPLTANEIAAIIYAVCWVPAAVFMYGACQGYPELWVEVVFLALLPGIVTA